MMQRKRARGLLGLTSATAALVLAILPLWTTSCGYMMRTSVYPSAPDHPLAIVLSRAPGAAQCEFSITPPTGHGWMMPPGNRGPESVKLKFFRYLNKILLTRVESIVVYSLRDTSLYNPVAADAEWLGKLLGDSYSWSDIGGLALEVEGTRSVVYEGRGYRVVDYSASYHVRMNAGDSFDRGVVYVMKSPCDTWQGLLVFGLRDTSYGEPQSDLFPTPEAAAILADVMRSLILRPVSGGSSGD